MWYFTGRRPVERHISQYLLHYIAIMWLLCLCVFCTLMSWIITQKPTAKLVNTSQKEHLAEECDGDVDSAAEMGSTSIFSPFTPSCFFNFCESDCQNVGKPRSFWQILGCCGTWHQYSPTLRANFYPDLPWKMYKLISQVLFNLLFSTYIK